MIFECATGYLRTINSSQPILVSGEDKNNQPLPIYCLSPLILRL